MYNNLVLCLDSASGGDEASTNEWFDYLMDDSIEIISKFTDDDWKQLFDELPSKKPLWKQHLVECMTDFNNDNQMKVFVELLKDGDVESLYVLIGRLFSFHGNEALSMLEKAGILNELTERVKIIVDTPEYSNMPNFKRYLEIVEKEGANIKTI